MSLRHAILGFLSIQPFSGYDLKKAFDHSVRHFWAADKAAIYRMLAELEKEGLITGRRVAQAHRPDRIDYALSPTGRQEFERWMITRLEPVQRREPFLIKVFFSDRLGPEARRALFEEEIATVDAELAVYAGIVAALVGQEQPLTGPLWTLHAGRAAAVAWRGWLVTARDGADLDARALLADLASGAVRTS